MTSVGELFVSLGVKGSEKTVGAITTVKDGLKGIASTSLETKAAIVASIYAIERLFQASSQRGTALENFNALTGVATKTVQQYQWAAQQVGVSNDEVSNSFLSLQKNMTKTLLGKGAPEGLGMFARKGGNVTAEDIARYQEHPEELLQKLQQYAQTEKNKGLRNEVLSSFGLGNNMISALDRNAFRPEVLNKAPTYNDAQIASLDKANAGWKNLGTTVEMIFGKLNAKHGLSFISDIQKLLPPIEKVINALVTFAEKIHLFEGLGKVFDLMAKSISAVGNIVEEVNKEIDSTKKDPEKMKFIDATKDVGGSIFDSFMDAVMTLQGVPNKPKPSTEHGSGAAYFKEKISKGAGDLGERITPDYMKKFVNGGYGQTPAKETPAFTPNAPASSGASTTQNINVSQTMTFQSDDNAPKDVAHAFKRDVQNAARQLSALGQGS